MLALFPVYTVQNTCLPQYRYHTPNCTPITTQTIVTPPLRSFLHIAYIPSHLPCLTLLIRLACFQLFILGFFFPSSPTPFNSSLTLHPSFLSPSHPAIQSEHLALQHFYLYYLPSPCPSSHKPFDLAFIHLHMTTAYPITPFLPDAWLFIPFPLFSY